MTDDIVNKFKAKMDGKVSYEFTQSTPTVVPKGLFLIDEDIYVLRRAITAPAMRRTDILKILTKRSLNQRLEIISRYNSVPNRNLTQELQDGFTDYLRMLLMALLRPIHHFYAEELHGALEGFNTDENVSIEVLCTLRNKETLLIKNFYQQQYRTSLKNHLAGDVSVGFKGLLGSLCEAQRKDINRILFDEAKAKAQELFNAGENRWGTKDPVFNRIVCGYDYPQLRQIFKEYEELAGHTLEQEIESKFSGYVQEGFLAIIECIKDRTGYFAKQFRKAIRGIGTDNRTLIRLVVTRCEIDLGAIKEKYEELYNESLVDAIREVATGDFQTCLLNLMGE